MPIFTFIILGCLSAVMGQSDSDSVKILPSPTIEYNECPDFCPMNYEPICCLPENSCGEPLEFSNNCGLDVYNCNNPNNRYYEYSHTTCTDISSDPIFVEEPILVDPINTIDV